MNWRITALLFLLLVFSEKTDAQNDTKKPLVFLLPLDAEIDARSNRLTSLALEKAIEIGADYVVIEMDTYGGALNDADDIRTRVLEFEKPIYVYINKDAASAGALISIACDSIYMAKGASIGAATVVTQEGEAAPDKYQSYMRSIMRSTAEATGRNPKIAEAMVDQEILVDSISTQGKVITFSTNEAIQHHFCEAQVANIDQIMIRSNVTEYELYIYELSAVEQIISIFINPFVSGILIMVIMGGIYFELQSPGIGFPIFASLVALVLYFTPYYLNGLADHWEMVMFLVGIVFLGLEIFVIPGFGLAGVFGIILMMLSLILVMLNNDWFDFTYVLEENTVSAILTAFLGLIGAFALMIIIGMNLIESKMFKRVALQTTLDNSAGYTANFNTISYLGERGIAYTVLRPSGKVKIGEKLFDAYTRGSYIAQGTIIEVINEQGTSLTVKAVDYE